MQNFVSKVLKTELFLLFILTIISFLSLYPDDMIPDNAFVITSTNKSYSFISYYFISAAMYVEYYTGLWTLFTFAIFCLFYIFIFSKRLFITDTLNVFALVIACLCLSYCLAPNVLGEGILYLIKTNFSSNIVLLFGVIAMILFLFGTYRGNFFTVVKEFFASFRYVKDPLSLSIFQKTKSKVSSVKNKISVNSHLKILSALKGENGKASSHKEEPTDKKESTIKEKIKSIKNIGKSNSKASSDKQYYNLVHSSLNKPSKEKLNEVKNSYFQEIKNIIEQKLSEFKIDGKIINILKGPVVDTFELALGSGVKISQVISAENELSIALSGTAIRIVYPMIGRTTVGIEIPRNPRTTISLGELLSSTEFKNTSYRLPIVMGRDVFGDSFVVDLSAMPHMLVAGTTGSGKSVFINSVLISLIAKKLPNQMKLILIDPKQLELMPYENLPHLALPVITDASVAGIALRWACQEMDRRYSILREFGVRSLDGFNQKCSRLDKKSLDKIRPYYSEGTKDFSLPYFIIIIDEFADLILTRGGKDVENNICRLAAKARAAGMHLIIATQRPSVDVITGLIKSNFPTRISFKVTSGADSRTILSDIGAEKLLGKGDMLYRYGTINRRAHSPLVEENEVEALNRNLSTITQEFLPDAIKFMEEKKERTGEVSHFWENSNQSDDELYDKAVSLVVDYGTASASMLQRHLKIGYNRAANLIEELERRNIVGPAEGSKRRKVLNAKEL